MLFPVFQLKKYEDSSLSSAKVKIDPDAKGSTPLLAATSFLHCFSARSQTSVNEEATNKSASMGSICVAKEVTEERRKQLGKKIYGQVKYYIYQGQSVFFINFPFKDINKKNLLILQMKLVWQLSDSCVECFSSSFVQWMFDWVVFS